MHILVEALTRRLFSDAPAFQLAGEQGRQRLLSALEQPKWPQYRIAQHKAAELHYSINKGHPYVDGNKRLALTAMLTFLRVNGFVLLVSHDMAEWFALGTANGSISREDGRRFVETHATRLTWSDAHLERMSRRVGRLMTTEEAIEFVAADVRTQPAQFGEAFRSVMEKLLAHTR